MQDKITLHPSLCRGTFRVSINGTRTPFRIYNGAAGDGWALLEDGVDAETKVADEEAGIAEVQRRVALTELARIKSDLDSGGTSNRDEILNLLAPVE